MKEAAGEANMTVITIVLIGLVAAAGAIIIPRLLNNMKDRSCCQEQGGVVEGANCVFRNINTNTVENTVTLKNYNNNCN